jgi:hypothetical protein
MPPLVFGGKVISLCILYETNNIMYCAILLEKKIAFPFYNLCILFCSISIQFGAYRLGFYRRQLMAIVL